MTARRSSDRDSWEAIAEDVRAEVLLGPGTLYGGGQQGSTHRPVPACPCPGSGGAGIVWIPARRAGAFTGSHTGAPTSTAPLAINNTGGAFTLVLPYQRRLCMFARPLYSVIGQRLAGIAANPVQNRTLTAYGIDLGASDEGVPA
jgi:hypothetical protein